MKRIAVTVLLLCLECGSGFAVVWSIVDAPQDNVKLPGGGDTVRNDSEVRSLAAEYNELLRMRFRPLELADVRAIFGAKLERIPEDRIKPLFVPGMVIEFGVSPIDGPSKRHNDLHALGNVGYLDVHYQDDGESVASTVIYLRADENFVPLKSVDDIPRRLAWDKAKFELLKKWLDEHGPKLIDLGVVEVSASCPSRVGLGGEITCILTIRGIQTRTAAYWFGIDIEKETMAPKENSARRQFVEHTLINRPNQPLSFAVDGKLYQLTPKLVEQLQPSSR